MSMPEYLKTESGGAVASYNYFDIAEGSGITVYYGCSSAVTTTISYNLLTTAVYSNDIDYGGSTKTFEFYSPVLNFPKTIAGTAYFSAGLSVVSGGPVRVSAQLKKYDGTTDVNVTSAIVSGNVASGSAMVFLKLPCTQTHFKKGEQLHLTVIFTVDSGEGGIGLDPKGRAGTHVGSATVSSTMALYCPFRLEI